MNFMHFLIFMGRANRKRRMYELKIENSKDPKTKQSTVSSRYVIGQEDSHHFNLESRAI